MELTLNSILLNETTGKYDVELKVTGSNKNTKICLTLADEDLKEIMTTIKLFILDNPEIMDQVRGIEQSPEALNGVGD